MTFFFFFVLLGHALKLSTRLRNDMEPAVVVVVVVVVFFCCIFFDIIIVRWLLADSCVYLIFFSFFLKNSFLRAQCLMADSAGDKAHLNTVTAHTLHARY